MKGGVMGDTMAAQLVLAPEWDVVPESFYRRSVRRYGLLFESNRLASVTSDGDVVVRDFEWGHPWTIHIVEEVAEVPYRIFLAVHANPPDIGLLKLKLPSLLEELSRPPRPVAEAHCLPTRGAAARLPPRLTPY